MSRIASLARARSTQLGIITGVVYGIVARYVVENDVMGQAFVVMSIGFIFVVPLVLGVVTVRNATRRTWSFRIFAPWVPMLMVVAAATAIGWEGAICVFMSLPVLLVMSSIGGLLGGADTMQRRGMMPAVLAFPFVVGWAEQGVDAPVRLVETTSVVQIAAAPDVVWPLVASVDSIRPEERRPALFIALGFPQPVSATISGRGVGAVREARFERGLVFTEVVTEWIPGERLSFTIDPNTESIPPTTLDPHVTIGGPFFDVLTGTYELHAIEGGQATRLVLRSRHRVSTRFNGYAAWWANRVMSSIQENILAVHRERAERMAA